MIAQLAEIEEYAPLALYAMRIMQSGGELATAFVEQMCRDAQEYLAELLERFELDPTKNGRTYTKGNRQKVALVAALAADVELLVLDEPTSGLRPADGNGVPGVHRRGEDGRAIGSALQPHPRRGREALRTVTIIRAGRAVQSGTLAELRHLTRTTITATLDHRPTDLATITGVHDLRYADYEVTFDAEQMPVVIQSLGQLGVRTLHSAPPSLEQLFLRQYGDELVGAES